MSFWNGEGQQTSWPSYVKHVGLLGWVTDIAALTQPDQIYWCDGSQEEYKRLCNELVATGTFLKLSETKRPNSYLARSDPTDVARIDDRTFICSVKREDAGPTNNWIDPAEMLAKLQTGEGALFRGSMKGRTMYVVPFSMGPLESSFSRMGIALSDSPYVVVNMHLLTRVDNTVFASLGTAGQFVRCVHSVGAPLQPDQADVAWPCNQENKYIAHFPETREIWSYGSSYGANALLSTKSFALRIASSMAHEQGWLAEHMQLFGVTNALGRKFHVATAISGAHGNMEFSMQTPPSGFESWKVTTVSNACIWINPGADGRLYAINPEAGYLGLASDISVQANANGMNMLRRDVIFTNVALTDDGDVWWEGMTDTPPAHLIDWQGNDWTPAMAKEKGAKAAHPNARFTVAATNNPALDSEWDNPAGVAIDAFIFGGRRSTPVPLVTEARDWSEGVYMGATIGSEALTPAFGQHAVVRRNPFDILPFIGYNVSDYFQHWLNLGARLQAAGHAPPKIYGVNWFRKGAEGKFIWPGHSENMRILAWMVGRLQGIASGVENAFGISPTHADIDWSGLDFSEQQFLSAMVIDRAAWEQELKLHAEYFAQLAYRLPEEIEQTQQHFVGWIANGPTYYAKASHTHPSSHIPHQLAAISTTMESVQKPESASASLYALGEYRTKIANEVMNRVMELLGDQAEVEKWMSMPAIGLDGKRPIDMLQSAGDRQLLSDFLLRLEYGVYN